MEVSRQVHRDGLEIGERYASGASLCIWSKASGGHVPADILQVELERPSDDMQRNVEVLQAEGIRLLAAGRPEQLLTIWQAQAESRRSNPFLYLGRHTEFIIRRCFLPYAILFFALFNITQVAFILSAVGANIVWLIALYSHRTFVAPSSTVASTPVSA